MMTEQRKRHILEILKSEGRVIAKSLSAELSLSEDTIRRDLRELAADGLLQRVHGGALPASPTMANLVARRGMSVAEKARLGRAGARLIEAGQTIMLDGGTTNLELVRNLPLELKASVVTHSPAIAAALEFHEGIDVIMIGGRLFRHSMVTTGAAVLEAIARLHADIFFLGVTGIQPQEGLTTGDFEEAHVKRALMARAAETVVLATSEKLGAVSPHQVAPLEAITTLVVADERPLEEFTGAGIALLRA